MISVDVGYGNTKVFNGKKEVGFPSVYYACNDNYTLRDKYDMMITIDGQDYFVGMSALKMAGESPFDKEDMLRHKIFMLTAICKMTDGDFSDKVLLGLPIGDYVRMKPSLEKLKGKYNVKYNGIERIIDITNISVYAQSESFYGLLCRQDPSIRKDIVGIIDIGQKTVDVAYFDEGTYVSDRSGSFDLGVINAYQDIAEAVATKLGFEIEDYRARKYISKVPEDAERAFATIATGIKNRIYRKHWNFKELDRLYIIGGGTEYIEKYFSDAPYVKFNDAVFANARSYMEGETND